MLDRISQKFSDLFRSVSGNNRITEQNVRDVVQEIKVALLEADVNVRVVRRFVNRTLEDATGDAVLRSVSPGQMFTKIVHDRLVEFLGDERQDLQLKGPDTVSPILLLGLQGSGKTTTAAKLAARLSREGRKVLLVAADLVRPAAVDQLQVLGERIGVAVHVVDGARDPVAVAKAGLKRAKKELYDTVIVDTSGRMQVDAALMKELQAVKKVVQPVESVLVADSMTGQSAVDIAKEFNEQIGLSGIILSKFDSDARGGAALSLKTITGTPIKFIGVGEKTEDLEPFYPDRIAGRILGMGDVVSLVEKAQETIDEQEALELQQKMAKANFSLADYLDQIQRVKKMGSMESLLGMIPGMQGRVSEEDLNTDELKYEEAILQSMTRVELENYRIIGINRRKRIARGSGTTVYQVNRMLKKFDKMRTMMKKVTKNKKYQAQLMQQLGGMQ
ncbi:signal recognition particle protein [Spirochaeta africana]|uniref:Signal recognition particle protein n=1 Tax=Spirochaeta africana (strain ATCC 700263 / DSM 8902 / Z-7692) TaxID=889378 RepID=H9UIE6_SPIAZ|nr:signal recognition particle protein [Spirochaeta africana]AFG37289.1 signal recognition particle protein [Spirochaeta africana DSM 8902]